MTELQPLLKRGQRAEWRDIEPPSADDIRNSWLVRAKIDRDGAARVLADHGGRLQGMLCGGPGCDRFFRAGERALLMTWIRGGKAMRLAFCSVGCQRRNRVSSDVTQTQRDRAAYGTHGRRA